MKPPKAFLPGRRQSRRRASPRLAWEGAGLALLGLLAAGMAAFPDGTLAVMRPVRGAFALAWETGLSGMDAVRSAGRNGLHLFRSASGLARRNAELEGKLEAAAKEGALREEEKRELVRLRRLLDFREALGERAVAAHIIGFDPSAAFTALVIDKGGEDGVRDGAPVAAPAGAVGRVQGVGPDYATVLWLCDPRSRIAAYVQRSRVVGVLAGNGDGCELKYIPVGEDVQVGDRVLTAGRGSVFPKGILIGTVKEVRKEGLSLSAVVAPVVNVKRLEEVLVISRGAAGR
jgi:rod shape-determining protein MreC